MPRSGLGLRLAGLLAAVACVAGMTVAAGPAASGSPVAAATQHTSATPLPAHVFAPYYFNSSDTLAATSRASGADVERPVLVRAGAH